MKKKGMGVVVTIAVFACLLLCTPALAVEKPDLTITAINAYHYNPGSRVWFNLSNDVDVTVKNNGTAGAGVSFNVSLYADGDLIGKKTVSGLGVGEMTTVQFTWTPVGDDCFEDCFFTDTSRDYSLKAIADCDFAINESDETNNERIMEERICYNGYMADEPLENVAHGKLHGGLLFMTGDGSYGGLYYPGSYRSTTYEITLPAGAAAKLARLNVYYTWQYATSCPEMEVSITYDGNTYVLPVEKKYNDLKCGEPWNFPWGNYVFNLTDYIQGSGTYTVTVKRTGGPSFCIAAPGIEVLYEDKNKPLIEYWVNEGADLLLGGHRSDGGYLSLEECITPAIFEGGESIDLSKVKNATLAVVSPWAGSAWAPGTTNHLYFNGVELGQAVYHGYDETYSKTMDGITMHIGSTNAQVGVNVSEVTSYLKASDNVVGQGDNGDCMMPANAFLVISYEDEEKPTVAISTDKTSYTRGEKMHLGLDVKNPLDSVQRVRFVIYLAMPTGGTFSLIDRTVTLPPGLDYSNPDFVVFQLPGIPAGTYTWHAILEDPLTAEIICEDTASWEFVLGGTPTEDITGALEQTSIVIDFDILLSSSMPALALASADELKPDLTITAIKPYHYEWLDEYEEDTPPIWFGLTNYVEVTVENIGKNKTDRSFVVTLYADDDRIGSEIVEKLLDPEEEDTVDVIFEWMPEGEDPLSWTDTAEGAICTYTDTSREYTLKAVVDKDNEVDEGENEENNEFIKEQEQKVIWNGYTADQPLKNYVHDEVEGGIIYTTGDGQYRGRFTDGTEYGTYYDVNYDLEIPGNVKLARFYIYHTWTKPDHTAPKIGVTLKTPSDDTYELSMEKSYNDIKGDFGAWWYVWGTYAYDITGYVEESGTYVVTVTNLNDGSDSNFGTEYAFAAPAILVVYEDATAPKREYWINEGADILIGGRRGDGGFLDLEECLNSATFDGEHLDLEVEKATLAVVSAWGDSLEDDILYFNGEELGEGVYCGYHDPWSTDETDEEIEGISMIIGKYEAQMGIAAFDVTGYLEGCDNEVIQGDDGDNMMPVNAFLVITYEEEDGEEEEEEGGEVTSGSPNITAGNPVESVVNNTEGELRTFTITVNQTVDISWRVNGTEVQTNESITEAAYTNTSAVVGILNVSAIATNSTTELSDIHTWIWHVTSIPTATPTSAESITTTATPTATSTSTVNVTPTPTPTPASTPASKSEEKKKPEAEAPVPGFELPISLFVLITVAYIRVRYKNKDKGKKKGAVLK